MVLGDLFVLGGRTYPSFFHNLPGMVLVFIIINLIMRDYLNCYTLCLQA